MGDQVKVSDVQTIERFRAVYATALEAFGLALQDAESDVERTCVWLDAEIAPYWQKELRRGQDQVVMCKSALFRKQEIKSTPDARPSVVSERKALEKAKRRVALCEEKLRFVHRGRSELPRQAIVFKAALSPMATLLDRDGPRILAMLHRMTEHLEEYLRSSPEETERLLDILGVTSVKRAGEAEEAKTAEVTRDATTDGSAPKDLERES